MAIHTNFIIIIMIYKLECLLNGLVNIVMCIYLVKVQIYNSQRLSINLYPDNRDSNNVILYFTRHIGNYMNIMCC